MDELRLLVVAGDPLALAGLGALLNGEPGIEVVAQGTPGDATSLIDGATPDVVVWDLGWDPETSLAEIGGELPPHPAVVALIPADDAASEAWVAGARAILGRDAPGPVIAAAVQAAFRGLAVFAPDLAASLLPGRERPAPALDELTPRELEVLRLLARGMTNKAIAAKLEISEHTVKFHVNAVMSKLGAESRTEAVVRATRLGLVYL